MYKIRGLTPRQDFGILHPPAANSLRNSNGITNLLPPDVPHTSSVISDLVRSEVHVPLESGRHNTDCMSTSKPMQGELEMASITVPAVTSQDKDRLQPTHFQQTLQTKSAMNTNLEIVPKVLHVGDSDALCQSSSSGMPFQVPSSVDDREVISERPSLIAPRDDLSVVQPHQQSGRIIAQSSSQHMPCLGEELLGSPDGDDSMMSNHSLLDMNTEDPFKAGEGVRSKPPHSSPYAQSPLENPDAVAQDGMGGCVLQGQLEQSLVPTILSGSDLSNTDASPGMSNTEMGVTVNAHHASGHLLGAFNDAAVGHADDVTSSVERWEERTRGGGEEDEACGEDTARISRRKWSRMPPPLSPPSLSGTYCTTRMNLLLQPKIEVSKSQCSLHTMAQITHGVMG